MTRPVVTRTARHRVVAAAIVLLLVAVITLNRTGSESIAAAEGELPPAAFELFDGQEASFADFEGKPLVINFWASWCPACVNELPEFQKTHERLGDEVAFLGLANTDRRSSAEDLAAEVGLTYVLGDDPEGELFRSLELIAMPTTLFVTPDGEITEVFAGQLTESALEERIDELRAQS